MDAWPGYCDGQTTAPEKSKGKAKAKDERVEAPWRYPVVDHGALSAATLRKKGKRYEWTFVSEGKSDHQLVATGNPVEVFPPTRPKAWRGPKATELQRAEKGAHFLRTFYPDIDIQTELIRDEITEDTRLTQALRRDDPYAGNMIDITSLHVSRKNLAYLAFPMGETNSELNMSPVLLNPKVKVNLRPTAAPVYSFDTPIQQILASPHTEIGKGKTDPMLGVRTMGSTAFMQLKLAVYKTSYSIEPVPVVVVQRSDIGDRHAVDMAISPTNTSVGYVVNDAGAIFRCAAPEGKRAIDLVHTGEPSERSLYRIAALEVRETLLSMSSKAAFFLDLRAGKRSHSLYTVTQPEVVLTSIETLSDDHITRLVSSHEILWIDERNTRKPLLAVRHGREMDTTLRTHTRVLVKSPLTFLTSRNNSLVTVYDVSRASDNLVHIRDTPYALPPVLRPDGRHFGYAFFQEPTLSGSKQLSIFQLSERGGVSLLNLQRVSNDAVKEPLNAGRSVDEWPAEVKKLGEDAERSRSDLGPLAGRAHSIVDLEPAYKRLFVDKKEQDLAAQTNAVFDILERMPTFWQDTEVPVEHSVTMFDIAMRSGSEPLDASRNDWFTGSALDSAAGYRALTQGRLPRDILVQKSPWHLNLSPFIRRSVPEHDDDPQKVIDILSRYDLADGPGRTAPSYRWETEARGQLALDLALASDVYAHKRPGKDVVASFDEDLLNISRSTEAMTLGEIQPPPVHFSFLRPISKLEIPGKPTTSEDGEDEPAAPKSIMPLGVRLLLQEWEVGADPRHYVYRDPYDEAAEPPIARRYPLHGSPGNSAPPAKEPGPPTQTQTQSQRPPAVVSSIPRGPPAIAARPPTAPRKPLVATRSEAALAAPAPRPPPSGSQPANVWTAPPSSQEFMASTQVLPGPHGGRPVTAKKKAAKKRLGGF